MPSIFAFAYYLLFGWSGLRIGSLTLFDIASVLVFPFLLFFRVTRGASLRDLHLKKVLIPCGLFLSAIIISTYHATDEAQHVTRGVGIALGLTIAAVNAALFMSWHRIRGRTIMVALLFSSIIHSLVVIAQGQFAMFRNVPAIETWQPWTRAIGLAEHPIEAGAITAYGIFIQAYLVFSRKQTRFPRLPAFFNVTVLLASLLYSGSLTIFFALAVSLISFALVTRRAPLILALIAVASLAGLSQAFTSFDETQLGARVSSFADQGGSYGTVETRSDQIAIATSRIGLGALLRGNGYNESELPNGLEIHNTAVAAVFHFGILGLIGQVALLLIPMRQALRQKEREYSALVSALLIVFLSCYLTGPSLGRRSIWVPLLIVGMLPLPSRKPQPAELQRFSGRPS